MNAEEKIQVMKRDMNEGAKIKSLKRRKVRRVKNKTYQKFSSLFRDELEKLLFSKGTSQDDLRCSFFLSRQSFEKMK